MLIYFLTSAFFVNFTDYGVLGLAWATTITAYLELFLFIVFLQARAKCFSGSDFWWPQIKMLTSSFLMAVFLYLPFRILDEVVFDTSRTLELVALTFSTGTVGMLVYIYFSYLFDVKELRYISRVFSMFNKWSSLLGNTKEIVVDPKVESNEV